MLCAICLTGFDIDLRDLFSLGIYIESDDFMRLQITDITVTDNQNAVATATMDLTGVGVQAIYFYMVYENDGWYISDMTDRALSGNNGSVTQNTNDSGSTDTALYYVTTYSDILEYGTTGTYTEYNYIDFAVGSTVLLEATVNEEFNFEGRYVRWSDVCLSTDLRYEFEMKAENANIEARYSYYTVNVNAKGDDYGMAGTYTNYSNKKVSVGDTVILTATVNEGYNFEGWYAEWREESVFSRRISVYFATDLFLFSVWRIQCICSRIE